MMDAGRPLEHLEGRYLPQVRAVRPDHVQRVHGHRPLRSPAEATVAVGVLAVAVWAPEAGAVQGAAAPTATTDNVWLDAEGAPLPFQSDAEISHFLRTARVVSKRDIDVGINRAEKLLLEKDGTRAHAIFRVVDIEEKHFQLGPRLYLRFRDSYRNERAAHELARWIPGHSPAVRAHGQAALAARCRDGWSPRAPSP